MPWLSAPHQRPSLLAMAALPSAVSKAALSKLLELYCGCQNGGMWSRFVGLAGQLPAFDNSLLLRHVPHLTFVDLSNCQRFTAIGSCFSCFGAQLLHCSFPSIASQDTATTVAACISRCCRLQSTRLSSSVPLDTCLTTLPKLPCLRLLVLDGTPFSAAVFAENIGRCPHLQKLEMNSCAALNDACVLAVVRGCPDLLSITFFFCRALTSKSLQHIGAHAHSLRSLEIVRCSHVLPLAVASADWPAFCAGIPQLRLLQLGELTDAHLPALCRCCPRLQYLRLPSCPALTDDAMWQLARSLCCLRALQLSSSHATDAGVAFLLVGCPHLELLDVADCVALTAVTSKLLSSPSARERLPSLHSVLLPSAIQLPSSSAPGPRVAFPQFRWPNAFAADPLATPAIFFA